MKEIDTELVQQIHHFWFGKLDGTGTPSQSIMQQWWQKSLSFDQEIETLFEPHVIAAGNGQYDHWQQQPQALLALIILLDQFTRNIYRDSAEMYQHDDKALAIAFAAIEQKQDQALLPVERLFIYLPLEHAENLQWQYQCVNLCDTLRNGAPSEQRAIFEGFYDYAVKHQQVIEQFGRFPHRNRLLGRESTAEEIEYLQQKGAGF